MSRYRTPILLIGLVALITTACGTLGSGGSDAHHSPSPVTDRILERGEIRIGMSGNQPPFTMKNRAGELFGMDVDLARGLARTMGVEASLVTMPFKDLLPALKKGEIDAVFSGMTMTAERNLQVPFAGPYFISGKAALTKSEEIASADQPKDVRSNARMAVLAGSTSELFAQRELPEVDLVSVADYGTGVQMVIDDEVDAMIADYPATVVALYQHPDVGLSTTVSTFSFEPIGVALAPEAHLLTNVIQNYFTLLEGTGALERLRIVWFDDGAWIRELPR